MLADTRQSICVLYTPKVKDTIKVGIDVATVRNDVKAAKVQMYSQAS
ncbi:hypothetical protein [Pleurocapsa sp. PCC 7319]|nr:hypothetical protein [Pleurocapsa sp. PCC 7319]